MFLFISRHKSAYLHYRNLFSNNPTIKNMKKFNWYLIIILSAFAFSACVQTISTSTTSDPKIIVYSPKSGDTVQVAKNSNKIIYEASAGLGSQGIDRFEVFINKQSNEVFGLTSNGTNPTLYLNVDSNMVGQKISYYVAVYNKEGKFATSSVFDSILILENTQPPRKPYNLFIQRVSDNEVLLVWDDSSNNEDNFEVWRKDGDNGTYRVVQTLPANSTNWLDRTVSPFVTYYYKVRAVNAFGNSAFSNEVNSGGASGSPPSNLFAQALGASLVQLTWQDNSTEENGFKVQRKVLTSDPWTTIKILPPNSVEYIDQGLTQYTTYHYRVGAFTSNSEAYSSEVTVTTFGVDVPGPSNLVANFDNTIDAVKVTWSDNTILESGTVVERRAGISGNYAQIGVTAADQNVYLDTNITSSTLYYYRARHTTTEGFFTPYSNEDSAYVPFVPLRAPSNLEISEFVPNQIYGLFWTNNASTEDGIELWRRDGDLSSFHIYKILPPRTHAYNDTLQDPNLIYSYKVRAFLGSEYSNFSNIVSTAGGSGGIFRPTNLVATAVPNQLAVDLTWTDNSDNELGFEIERRITGSTTFTRIAIVGPNVQFYRDETDGLFRGTSYDYRVRAYNGQGFSDYSNLYQVTIPF